MPIDFKSDFFKSLRATERKELIINEFKKCKENFKYFVDNYALIRHPNAGIIKVKMFDFQYDVCIPIAIALQNGRTEKTKELVSKFKYNYDYKKHMTFLYEYYLDTYNKIPSEFHNFYKVIINHPEYIYNVDTLILKSRQTGLSTAFQLLEVWHANFYTSVYDLTLSQGDKEAIKFMSDMQRIYELLPPELKGRRLKNNDHELWISLGNKDVASILQAFTSTPKAGRSYSPNLVVLDEFAFWRKPEDTYTAISMALSGGGIMVIISTPNGVGNLYHKLWEMSKNYYSVYVNSNKKEVEKSNKEKDETYNIMKPVVVHWSQLPIEEFKRRGFETPIDWYNFMKGKLLIEGGERKVAQELDLDFIMSGETLLPFSVIKKLKENCIEKDININIIKSKSIDGLIIYEKPIKDYIYILGIDVSEGIFKDYHCIYVIKARNNKGEKIFPEVVAKYKSNNISPNKFSNIVILIGELYNQALINIEKNNPGLVVLSELIENNKYSDILIFNRYNPTTNKFIKNEKGWRTSRTTKPYLESVIKSHLLTYQENSKLPLSLLDEMVTFYEDSFHDDEVIAYGLSIIGYNLLDKYKEFLYESKKELKKQHLITNMEIDDYGYSSNMPIINDIINNNLNDIYSGNIEDDNVIINTESEDDVIKNKTIEIKNNQEYLQLKSMLRNEVENESVANNNDVIIDDNRKNRIPFNKFISKLDIKTEYDDMPIF